MTGAKHRIKHVPRDRDEQLLDWLHWRSAGVPASGIARKVGKNSGIVIGATNTVRDADLAESGEDRGDVLTGYWS